MINCIIVDDESLAQDVLEKYIKLVPELNLVAKLDNAIETISFLKENEIDIIFLDIQMPELSGLQMLKILNNPPKVILTTAFSKYALESYDFSIIDYLLKPIEFERFLVAIEKATKAIELEKKAKGNTSNPQENEFIFINQDNVTYKILLNDILYVKAEGNYVMIVTNSDKYITRETMNNMEKTLKSQFFIRVHKSYIVSIDKISKVFGNIIKINDVEIPIGNTYKLYLQEKLKSHN